jgi:hypothetical protein
MKRVTALLTLAVVIAASAFSATAHAAVRLGLGDQSLSVFTDVHFQSLGIKKMRVVTPWNVAFRRADRRYLDAWFATARSQGIEPLVTFTAAPGSRCPQSPCLLPSAGSYAHAFRAFRSRWPWIRVISAWNEANHRSQPTFRRPDQAARYFNVVRQYCRGCTVVAADVIDERNMVAWLDVFKRYARGERIWGLHNYRDTNPRRGQRYGGTKLLLDSVRGEVWLTETGGIVKFVLPDGRTLFRHSESRANRALGRMFRLAKQYRARIKRLYIYHWRQDSFANRFDAGLLRASGRPRASYRTVQRWLATPWFSP